MPSPTRESIPSLPPPATMQLHPPPSPSTHRALRKLQSAHNLGAKASSQGPSLISQQRIQLQQQLQLQQHQLQPPQLLQHQPQQRSVSPSRRHASSNRSPQRGRANSDAPLVHQLNTMAPGRRSALNKRSLAADAMSLDRLLREGPPNGDLEGALESARLKILDQGIKADSDGMVRVLETLLLTRRTRRFATSNFVSNSPPCASMRGSSFSTHPCSRPTRISN